MFGMMTLQLTLSFTVNILQSLWIRVGLYIRYNIQWPRDSEVLLLVALVAPWGQVESPQCVGSLSTLLIQDRWRH